MDLTLGAYISSLSGEVINKLSAVDSRKALKCYLKYTREQEFLNGLTPPTDVTKDEFLSLDNDARFDHIFKLMQFYRTSCNIIVDENKSLKEEMASLKKSHEKLTDNYSALENKIGIIQHNEIKNITDDHSKIKTDLNILKQILRNQPGANLGFFIRGGGQQG